MQIKDAIANIAQKRCISDSEAEYLFTERVGIKSDTTCGRSRLGSKSIMRQAYDELMGES